jgi:hypothetical protein
VCAIAKTNYKILPPPSLSLSLSRTHTHTHTHATVEFCGCYTPVCSVPYIPFMNFISGEYTKHSAFLNFPGGGGFSSSPLRPDRLYGPVGLLSNGYEELFPGGKAAGMCKLSHSNFMQRHECMKFYTLMLRRRSDIACILK